MRVLVAVVVIVLVGISDDSIADERISRVARNAVLDIHSDRLLADQCAKNGGPDAASIAETKIEAAVLQAVIDLDINGTFRSLSVQAEIEQNFLPLATYFCNKRQHHETFTTSFGEAVKPCFDADTKQGIDVLIDFSKNATRYFCDQNIEEYVKFANTGGFACLAMRQLHLKNCIGYIILDSSEANSTTITPIDSDEEDCIEGINFRECIRTEMKKCGNSTHEEFVVRFIDYFMQPICENCELFKKILVSIVTGNGTSIVGE